MDAEHGTDMKLGIREAKENCNSFEMLFWAPISIRGHTVLVASTPGTWGATNVNNLRMNGFQIRMTSDLWNEWPSHQAFLKCGSIMKGVQYDNWICFSMIYYAGATLPSNFRDLHYALFQTKYGPNAMCCF